METTTASTTWRNRSRECVGRRTRRLMDIDAEGVRVSRRLAMPPDAEEVHIGFRCAIDVM
jgi:hypothetical protein